MVRRAGKVKRIVRAPGVRFGFFFCVCVSLPFSLLSSVCVAVTSRASCVTLGRGVSLLCDNSSCDRVRVRVRVRAEETTNTRVVRGEHKRG